MGYKQKTALNYIFNLDMKVRDYECDLQGVVNNANYQHYMEHTRHEFLESLGANFGQMHEDGLDAFVTKVTISYKKSLRSGDSFRSALRCSMRAPKLIFHQVSSSTTVASPVGSSSPSSSRTSSPPKGSNPLLTPPSPRYYGKENR